MSQPRIVVTRRIPDPALAILREVGDLWVSAHDRPLERDELHAAISGADAVVTLLHDPVDEAFLAAAGPQLRCLANVAVGYDNIDVAAATRHGVLVTNTPGVLTSATADLAIALMLMVTRRLGEGERIIRSCTPWSWHMFYMLGRGLEGKSLGIVGLGAIGQAAARRARAFGMRILYSDEGRRPIEMENELEAQFLELDELFTTADVVSLHCPLLPTTRRLVNAQRLSMMSTHAYLINTARGPIVDEAALIDALRRRRIAGAALDVYENEPDVHPGLLELDNVVLVPHLGSATIETRTAMGVLAARNVLAVIRGEVPPTPVNLDVVSAGTASG